MTITTFLLLSTVLAVLGVLAHLYTVVSRDMSDRPRDHRPW